MNNLAPLRKFTNNVGNLGKIIVATGFEWLPKVQKIVQSGHTGNEFVLTRGVKSYLIEQSYQWAELRKSNK